MYYTKHEAISKMTLYHTASGGEISFCVPKNLDNFHLPSKEVALASLRLWFMEAMRLHWFLAGR